MRRWGRLLQLGRGLSLCPAVLVRLGQAAPPDFIAKAQRPRGVGQGPLDQAIAPFFSTVVKLTPERAKAVPAQPDTPLNHGELASTSASSQFAVGD